MQATLSKLKSRSTSKLQDHPLSSTSKIQDHPLSSTLKDETSPEDGPIASKSATITELYRQQGSFHLREEDESQGARKLVTRKSVIVPKENHWLQKPSCRGKSDQAGKVILQVSLIPCDASLYWSGTTTSCSRCNFEP